MDSVDPDGSGLQEALPPPPPVLPPDVVPVKLEEPVKKKPARLPMARRGTGTKGQKIPLLTNHFKVNVTNMEGQFYHYSVALLYEDGRPVEAKGVGRNNGNASPDAQGSPNDTDRKRMRRPYNSKTFIVQINFAAKIPMQAIASALKGVETESSQEALRVLDIILRQHAAKQGCLLVRQSFFHNDPKNFVDLGGGVLGCRGFHSSFRTTQGGLSLNIDVSTTMIIQPGPVVDFLIKNQNARDPFSLDWVKAKRVLKNLRIKVSPTNQEYKITGLSERNCKDQLFQLKQKGDAEPLEITVYDYFVNHRNIELRYSGDLPCINVGKPKRPTYIPLELCTLVSLQRYTKALTNLQRASLVEKSRQKPQERMGVLSHSLKTSRYDEEPLLRSCGLSISNSFTQVDGRVLQAPKVGNGDDLFARNGRWNFNNKKLVQPSKIERWAVVNFSARCDVRRLVNDLLRCAEAKGIPIEDPLAVIEENRQMSRAPAIVRVEKMFEELQPKLRDAPKFLLCVLPERKNCDVYGPWKRKNLAEFGIVTQCMAPQKLNDQYLTNLLLKINAKLGGLNSLLSIEHSPSIPMVSKVPTMILGMDVSHGSPGQSDIPSIAAVVSSRHWPLISRYRASVRTQSPRVEMIDSLYKRVSDTKDDGIMREALLDFYVSSGKRKPDQIIIFRDGVSESQFNQVLNIELDQIIEACKFLDEKWNPKFVVIVAQKNHHTKFFQPNGPENVPPGTIIDNKVGHPKNYDFYLCAHAGMIGTTRPTHYHVLLDQVGFQADDLQELVHSLSYVYQRSTTAISVVAPVCYAHLAATQMSSFMKFEDTSETSSSRGGMTAAGPAPVPALPTLTPNVANSMFFC
ncbi:unnamed protein product [Linum tenue]|uniref:Argonaute 4 n=1 Tax=Linum tenue TaxID=586396 RepID=A0AAV0IJF3_9ROSI|nr:unnamed protein product [Linum tenue]